MQSGVRTIILQERARVMDFTRDESLAKTINEVIHSDVTIDLFTYLFV